MPESSSFASPYTSIGSQSSFKNISQLADKNYSFLSYKAEVLRNDQENKSKAVMEALKCLQEKIQYLESDRDQAEQNLKSLANKAQTYKQKLLSNNVKTFEGSTISKNLDLEDKLECAKKRCEILEQQLDTSRTMMFGKRMHSPSNKTNVQPLLFDYYNRKKLSVGSTNNSSAAPLVAVEQATSLNEKSCHEMENLLPTIEKVNKLQEEHLKLSASQALTENKIQKLEKRIQEAHKNKQVSDKQIKQNVDNSTTNLDGDTTIISDDNIRLHKKTKKKVNSNILDSRAIKSKSSKLSNDHYSMKDIPFVVGKSSGKSHSLGANIQSVLSILKLHNNLCHKELKDHQPTSDSIKVKQKMNKYDKKIEDISVKDIEILLGMLQDELAQLGFAHHEVSTQINEFNNEKQKEEYKKMLDRMEQKMELKSNQIHIIKSHIENHKKRESTNKPSKLKDNDSILQDAKSKDNAATSKSSCNPHLIMLRKSKLLQQTLRKGDLHWE